MRQVLRRLWYAIRQRQHEADIAEELDFHRARAQHDREASGQAQAANAARRQLGNLTLAREDARRVWIWPWLDSVWQDAMYAFRSFRRQPGFTAIAVLTLAVGTAANTAIFSVSDALVLRPLPYPDADRLVALRSIYGSSETPGNGASSASDVADWQAQATSFEAIAGYRWRTVDLRGGAHSERLRGLYVTPEYFTVFGITDVSGRTFRPSDRGTNAIVLGRGVWERRFSQDPSLIGSTLDVNMINLSRAGATPNLVVGAARVDAYCPPITGDFNLGVGTIDDRIDFWLPEFPAGPRSVGRGLDVVAKLRPGLTLARAQTEMDAIARHLAEAFPDTNKDWRIRVVPLRAQIAGGASRVVLLLSLGTGLVLVIACGNVATLLLVRGIARQREVAVRAALGASRARIARQFLIESLLIAIGAAIVGSGAAYAGIRVLAPFLPAGVPLIQHAEVNGVVLGFVVAVTAVTTGLTGIAPAWIASARGFAAADLHARAPSTTLWQHRAVGGLIAAQVALTIVLLVSTGLLLRSAHRLWHVDPGFTSDHVLTMTVSLPNNKFEWQHNVVFERDVTAAVKTLPGVHDAAAIQGVPMRVGGFWMTFSVEGMPSTPPADLPVAHARVISANYFRVMQIPMLDGRDFDARDNAGERGHPAFVIVNRTLAGRYWPDQRAVGKHLRMNPNEWVTVAGVVGDVRYASLDASPEIEIYLPDGIYPEAAMTLLAKTAADPLLEVGGIRARIAQIDREAFVTDVRSMDDLIGASLAARWFGTLLLTLCAAIALALALSGIYGIVSQAAVQRKLEIGIRMALGSTPARVIGLMLRRSGWPVVLGTAVGLFATAAVTRLLSTLLFGIQPLDPPTILVAVALFAAVALAAALIPARRATRVDPLVALRCE